MNIKVYTHTTLADLQTPVSLFLKIRDQYPNVMLLESSDYSSKANSQSLLCFDLLSEITITAGVTSVKDLLHSNKNRSHDILSAVHDVQQFIANFNVDVVHPGNGVFGYSSFDAVRYFMPNVYAHSEKSNTEIPEIRYGFYRFIILIDHFRDTLTLLENCPDNQASQINIISHLIQRQDVVQHNFEVRGEEAPNMTDQVFKDMVTTCKSHCQRGDVFQIVPSRRFSLPFKGDSFTVYRHLRSINPSPYLFFFDYASYKLFGSSPEVQIKVENGQAEIHPIAGTVKRTGDHAMDTEAAKRLYNDPKENAEHIMLVDLARNDLSKNCYHVNVEKYKEIQYFSHVVHLISVVKGTLKPGIDAYQIFADTFPAGTLSGAPKHKAITIIESLEPHHRGFYGGALGIIGLDGSLNHAIMIRSFMSYQHQLHYQAGAGVVIASTEEGELNEVNNKLAALKKAIQSAHQPNKNI